MAIEKPAPSCVFSAMVSNRWRPSEWGRSCCAGRSMHTLAAPRGQPGRAAGKAAPGRMYRRDRQSTCCSWDTRPDSMIVVHNRISKSPAAKCSMRSARVSSSSCPCPMVMRASGMSLRRWAPSIRSSARGCGQSTPDRRVPARARWPGGRSSGCRVHMGDDRQAFFRRGVNGRNVAHPGESHVQRARDRRGGQGQHIHFGAQFL